MTKVKNFHEKIEQDLVRIGAEVKARKMEGETRNFGEREAVKQSLKMITEAAQPTPPAFSGGQLPNPALDGDADLPEYMADANSEDGVKRAVHGLIDLAFKKGIGAAVSLARKTNPFVEDAFHDALVDKLLPELRSRGIID